ncbi:3'(2'),5'-bisphosphate nucleotidase CysQ [Lentibacter sp. XHP0401]|uniref:3'(2'),5'-bisphosphate nucleotidase CysQ n=1 Tax=Lentibacter sp. XHP0401 TaxID=2984334 RepID=UPI0021E951D9|nr:3'(2'),5'-bisphosphate nucleotidase CysQ [Lentibacter sp. XHP0401]MCV2892666.1 3'(2'),5'-bisphosphate nucleotidase CysQ [Lentibacter sp. XHP0401]
MQDPDLDLLIKAAQTSGEIATGFAMDRLKKWDKDDNAGPVTEADLAVNAYLEDTLQIARPDYGWLSEESEDTGQRLGKHRAFVIDPIDGTRSFIEGSTTWAHSFAIVEEGVPVAAVVYLPLRQKLYAAARGQGATLNGVPLRMSSNADYDTLEVLATKPVFEAKHWKDGAPTLKRAHRPSLAYRLALVAEGRFDAMITLRRSWEWDIAAGALLLSEAGARITDRHGAPLIFNKPDPASQGVLTANPEMHGRLLDALA